MSLRGPAYHKAVQSQLQSEVACRALAADVAQPPSVTPDGKEGNAQSIFLPLPEPGIPAVLRQWAGSSISYAEGLLA